MTAIHSPGKSIICVANQKGGVGKTTTTVNLGAALVERGERVLLVDGDPQAHLTNGLGFEEHELRLSLADLLTGSDARLPDCLLHTPMNGLDLVPATIDLSTAEMQLTNVLGRDRVLADVLAAPLVEGYDHVIIDTPPTLGLLTVNALVAARWVLIPVQLHYYPVKGLAHLWQLIEVARRKLNPSLDVLGILPTFFDARTNLSREILATLRETYPDRVFETVIKLTTRLAEAPIARKPVLQSASSSDASQSYRALAGEVLAIEARPGSLVVGR